MQFETLPDGWNELEYETGPQYDGPYTEELTAKWASDDDHIIIYAEQSVDMDGTITYPVIIEQHIEYDGFQTAIQSHARIGSDRREAESYATEFMQEVNDGEHTLRVLGIDVPEDNDFIQFFTMSDSELPGSMTGDQLIELIGTEQYENEIDDLPDEVSRELAAEELIQVDVFPRLKSDVDGYSDYKIS